MKLALLVAVCLFVAHAPTCQAEEKDFSEAAWAKEGVDMNASLAYVGRTLRTSACVWLCFVLCTRVWRVWVWVWGDIHVWRVACV